MHIELKKEEEKIIFKIKEEGEEIYKFVERLNKSLSINNESKSIFEKDMKQNYSFYENDEGLRKPKNQEINNQNQISNDNKIQDNNNNEIIQLEKKEGNENKYIVIKNDENYKENYKDENHLNNDNMIKISQKEINNMQKKEEDKIQVAKLAQIISDIFLSIQNLYEQKDIIMKTIREKLCSLKMDNELEEKENINIIDNIITSIIYSLSVFNQEEINNEQKEINPFSFNQVINCDNCD